MNMTERADDIVVAPTSTHFTSRHAISPDAAAAMGTTDLRRNFHIGSLFEPEKINLTYTHYDRMVVGGAMPVQQLA